MGPLLAVLALTAAVSATLLAGPRRFMRGRHISAPLVKRIGRDRALVVRQVPGLTGLPLAVTAHFAAYAVLLVVAAVWSLDDWLFPDDDDRRKRRRSRGRVRLRMPLPVRLRPVERPAGAWA